MSKISSALIMAAGLGTRMQPFSRQVSKPLIPVMGVPVTQFTVDALLNAGVSNIVANIHHLASESRSGLKSLECPGVEIQISDESDLLLGSAGGIRKALPLLAASGPGPFFRVNGDVLCDVDWNALQECHAKLRAQWGVVLTLTVFPKGPPGEVYREILIDESRGLVTGLGDLVSGRPFFASAAVLEHEALAHVPPEGVADFVTTILEPAIRAKKVGVFFSSGQWCDLGSPLVWLKSHLELMRNLESGNFSSPVSRLWRKRIEALNERLGEQIWISRRSKRPSHLTSWVTSWAGPCYWDQANGSENLTQQKHLLSCPEILGPHAVVYGRALAGQAYENGIGMNDDFVTFDPTILRC